MIERRTRSGKTIWFILTIGASIGFVSSTIVKLVNRLPYPPNSDQDGYLAAGANFAEYFTFMQRAPLYSMWVGIIYFFSGKNLETTFFAEKIISILLFSMLMIWLGWRLFDKWAGLLMFVWVWNCKYLLFETNGSHTLAACLFILSILGLFLPANIRLPAAMLMLFFSAMCRSEMWVVFIGVAGCLTIKRFRDWRNNQEIAPSSARLQVPYWIAAVLIGGGFYFTSAVNISAPEPERLSIAFEQNFAINYIERKGLAHQYKNPWVEWHSIWSTALPDAETPFEGLRKYPGEILEHGIYNLRLFVYAFPAIILGFDYPILMGFAFGFWALSFVAFNHPYRTKQIDGELKGLLTIWFVAILLLIPISIVLRVAARYYIQLMPVQMIIALAVGRMILSRFPNLQRPFSL